jgi:hypothetical protein
LLFCGKFANLAYKTIADRHIIDVSMYVLTGLKEIIEEDRKLPDAIIRTMRLETRPK